MNIYKQLILPTTGLKATAMLIAQAIASTKDPEGNYDVFCLSTSKLDNVTLSNQVEKLFAL